MSRGDLQEMEQSKTAVNANAKSAEPMQKLSNPGEGLSPSYEDVGGPTPENYKADDDSAKLKEPTIKTVSDVVNSKVAKADAMKKMAKEEIESVEEEVLEEEEIVSEEEGIDIEEDVNALLGGEELSEEFKEKAKVIFEAALTSKIKEIQETLEVQFEAKLDEERETLKESLTERVDSYLEYVCEEWMKENELAVERGLKGEIAEDFISGLKKLFEDHYIDVPDEKYDVLEDQASKIENLEAKLNEQIEKNVEQNKVVGEFKRQDIIDEASEDLADTAKEKFNKLAEEVEFSNEEHFKTKVATLKESYFGKKEVTSNEVDELAVANGETDPLDLTNSMAAYTAAISKTKDIKLVK